MLYYHRVLKLRVTGLHRKYISKFWGVHQNQQLSYSWVNPNRVTLTRVFLFVPFRALVKILASKQASVTPSLAVESSLRTLTGSVWFLLPPTVQHLPVLVWTCVCVCVRQNPNMHLAHKSHATPLVSHTNLLGLWIMVHAVRYPVHILLYYGFAIETQNVNTVVRRIGWFDKLSFK